MCSSQCGLVMDLCNTSITIKKYRVREYIISTKNRTVAVRIAYVVYVVYGIKCMYIKNYKFIVGSEKIHTNNISTPEIINTIADICHLRK